MSFAFVSCWRGHGSDWANRGRVSERPNSNAGADAERAASHRQGSRPLQRPRLKRQRLRHTSGPIPRSVGCPEVKHRSGLKPCSAPGSKQIDDLSEGSEPRTNAGKGTRSLKGMRPTNQTTVLKSSLPSNQPMERTPTCFALQRRSSARYISAG